MQLRGGPWAGIRRPYSIDLESGKVFARISEAIDPNLVVVCAKWQMSWWFILDDADESISADSLFFLQRKNTDAVSQDPVNIVCTCFDPSRVLY